MIQRPDLGVLVFRALSACSVDRPITSPAPLRYEPLALCSPRHLHMNSTVRLDYSASVHVTDCLFSYPRSGHDTVDFRPSVPSRVTVDFF
jgi:hypothetical protein